MLIFWGMFVIVAYTILSGIIMIFTIASLDHFGLLPKQSELVGKVLLIWGSLLLVSSYTIHNFTMSMLQPLINHARKKVRECSRRP